MWKHKSACHLLSVKLALFAVSINDAHDLGDLAIVIELHHGLTALGSLFLRLSTLCELHYETREGRRRLPTTAATFPWDMGRGCRGSSG